MGEFPEPDTQALKQALGTAGCLFHEQSKHDVGHERDKAVKNTQHNGGQPDQPDFLVETCSECLADTQYDRLSRFTIQISLYAVKKCFFLHRLLLSWY